MGTTQLACSLRSTSPTRHAVGSPAVWVGQAADGAMSPWVSAPRGSKGAGGPADPSELSEARGLEPNSDCNCGAMPPAMPFSSVFPAPASDGADLFGVHAHGTLEAFRSSNLYP